MNDDKIEGYSVSETKLNIYRANLREADASLESSEFSGFYITLKAARLQSTTRLSRDELLCMRSVLNKWFDKEEKN